MTTTQHNFRPDSLVSRVIAFFQGNPEEELGLDDITDKFDATRGNIHTLLSKGIELEFLKRSRNADGEWIYSAGKALAKLPARSGVDMDAIHASQPKRAPKGYASPRKALDIDSLVVEEDIPLAESTHKGHNKWAPLFDKLTKAGQSIQVPGDLRGAIGAAATKLNRVKTQGQFRVAMTSETTARVWRVA